MHTRLYFDGEYEFDVLYKVNYYNELYGDTSWLVSIDIADYSEGIPVDYPVFRKKLAKESKTGPIWYFNYEARPATEEAISSESLLSETQN